MDTKDLQAHMGTDEWFERLEKKWASHWELAWWMENISLTPDRIESSENYKNGVFATRAEARRATRVEGALFVAGVFNLLPSALAGVAVANLFMDESWNWASGLVFVTVLLGLMVGGFLFLAGPAFRRCTGSTYPVSRAMIAAWSSARAELECANEENTVPAILEKMGELEAELRSIYSTYDDIVSPVEKEQVELDFIQAACMIEVLAEDAVSVRNELYSTRRRQYFELA